jgi:hypothetical protein
VQLFLSSGYFTRQTRSNMERYARASKHTLVVCTCPQKVYTPSINLAAIHDLFSFSSLPSPSTTPFSLRYNPRLSPMAALVGLPIELLENVLVDLEIDDISSLSRTCKDAHRYLSPRVYHSINWCWKDDHRCPPYHLLLRTLLSNPSLAFHVKTINIHGDAITQKRGDQDKWPWRNIDHNWRFTEKTQSTWLDGQRRRFSLKSQDWQRIKAVVSNIALHREDMTNWLQELYRGNVDAFVALLVRQCQKVEQLSIGFGFMHRSVFLPKVFRRLIDTSKIHVVYPNLRSATFSLDEPREILGAVTHLDCFRLFLFLPSLVRFDTVFLEPVVFGWPSPTLTPQPAALSALILRKCTASEKVLEQILRCTPSLRHLVYDYHRLVAVGLAHYETYKEDEEPCWPLPKVLIQCHILSKALAHVKDTLESLVIKIRFDSDSYTEIDCPWNAQFSCCLVGRVKGLDEMPKMRSLEISWALLLGWGSRFCPWRHHPTEDNPEVVEYFEGFDPCPWPTILPPNLERIRFRDDLSNFMHYDYARIVPEHVLEQLFPVRSKSFAKLIRWEFLYIYRLPYYEKSPSGIIRVEWPYRKMRRIAVLCQRYNLLFEILREDEELNVVKVIDPRV